MKLCVVSNQSQYAASTQLLDKVLSLKGEVIVLTPENATFWAESYLARKSLRGAISGLSVTNFSRLFSKMYPSLTLASSEVCCMLIKKAVQSCNMHAFKLSSQKYGFSREVQKMLQLAGESGVSFSGLSVVGEGSLAEKLRDLSALSSAVQSGLPKGFVNQKMDYLVACAKQGFFKDKVVCFVGFDDISSSACKLVEEIIKSASVVYVAAKEYDKNLLVNFSVCDEFLSIAKSLNCSVEFERENTLSSRAQVISKNLYAKEPQAQEVCGVKVVRCKNRRDEVAFAASFVEQKVLQGYRYRDIEIVVPDFSAYKHIQQVFCRHGIPVFVDNGKSVSEHALFVLVYKFLCLAKNRADVKSAVSLLGNELLGESVKLVGLYQNFCDKHGIEFEDYKKDLSVGASDPNFEIAKQEHNLVREIIKLFPKDNRAESYVKSINAFLQKFGVKEKLEQFKQKQQDLESRQITEQVGERLEKLLGEIEMLLSGCTLTVEEFIEVWQSGVSSISLRLVPQGLDSVLVTNVSTSKHKDVPFLLVLGACEGGFPSVVQDNGLLSDAELKEIKEQYGLEIGPTTEHVNEIEKAKVCELFQNATSELVVTYPSTSGGEALYMSSSVSALCSVCLSSGKPLIEERRDKPAGYLYYKMCKSQAKSVAGAKEVAARLTSRAKTYKSFGEYAELLGSINKALEENGLVSPPEEREEPNYISVGSDLFFPRKTTSISQLESYFACPYLHFARYGLRLKEREVASIKALDIGNFLHKCLERVTVKFMERGDGVSDSEFSKIMKSVLSELVKEEKYQAKVNSLQLTALKAEACRLCYAVLKGIERSGFKPVSAELRFGKGGQLPQIKLIDSDVTLEGKIDRMDRCGNMVRLVDYKTGQVNLALDNLYYGKKVQLFAYLLSVLEDGKLQPAGVFYLPIKSVFRKDSGVLNAYKMQGYFSSDLSVAQELDHDLSLDNPKSNLVDMQLMVNKENRATGKRVLKAQTHILDADSLEKLASYSKALISGAVKEIEQGNIAKSPLDSNGERACDYCAFRCVCKIDEHDDWARKEKEKIVLEDCLGAIDGVYD